MSHKLFRWFVSLTPGLLLAIVPASAASATIAQPVASNRIVNGDFESGNTGFSSEYTFSPGDLFLPAVYNVLSDPSSVHPAAASFGDHTSGSGLMMAVNGAELAGLVVWSQSVLVTANTDYEFSAWVASWFPDSPAQLQFLSNGSPIGIFTASSTTGLWEQFVTTWNSGNETSTTIKIINLNTDFHGSDFTLDDLNFQSLGTTVVPVAIDIKPGSQTSPINPQSRGKITVAILSTSDFDAPSEVDKSSLTFGRTGSEPSLAFCNKKGEDVNSDGLLDLVCHFKTRLTGFQVGDLEGILKGQTVEGRPIEGHDAIRIIK